MTPRELRFRVNIHVCTVNLCFDSVISIYSCFREVLAYRPSAQGESLLAMAKQVAADEQQQRQRQRQQQEQQQQRSVRASSGYKYFRVAEPNQAKGLGAAAETVAAETLSYKPSPPRRPCCLCDFMFLLLPRYTLFRNDTLCT